MQMKKRIAVLLMIAAVAAAMAGCSGGEIETVFFGRYEQDGIAENGAEPIEWIVAHKDEEKTLLIAKDVLELLPYNALAADDSISLVFWEGSTLREWLNGAFMETAFTPEERARIAETANKNIVENDFHYSEDPDTIDTAFLLSKEEAEEYLRGDNMRIARPSACALAKGARVDNKGNCKWWMRSFSEEDHAYYIDSAGKMGKRGFYIYYYDLAEVRPAIWLCNE